MIAEGSSQVALMARDVEIASEEDLGGDQYNKGTGTSAKCHIT